MKKYKKVLGGLNKTAPILKKNGMVIVHTNIKKLEDNLYEYDEFVYTDNEYEKNLLDAKELMGKSLALFQLENMEANQIIQQLGTTLTQTQIELMQIKQLLQIQGGE